MAARGAILKSRAGVQISKGHNSCNQGRNIGAPQGQDFITTYIANLTEGGTC